MRISRADKVVVDSSGDFKEGLEILREEGNQKIITVGVYEPKVSTTCSGRPLLSHNVGKVLLPISSS